jgi:hypothetical protein
MRNQKRILRNINSGIIIIGEGITENYYFSHMKNVFGYKCTIRPRFFCKTCVSQIEKQIKEVYESGVTIFCVTDADVARRTPAEQQRLNALKAEYKNKKNVIFCDSMPCIEYWFLLHYKDTCPTYDNTQQVVRDLKKFIKNYEKTKDFLEKEKWAKEMSKGQNTNIDKACARAKKYKNSSASYSKIYLAIEELNKTL